MNGIRALRRACLTVLRSERASAAVELAIILPVLVLLVIGVADLSRVFLTRITVSNAARAGAQYGSQSTATSADTAGMNSAARQDALESAPITVTSRSFCRCNSGEISDCSTGDCGAYGLYRLYVEVTASKTVNLVFNYPGLPSSVALSRKATFRVQ